jgi:hypothetical protein
MPASTAHEPRGIGKPPRLPLPHIAPRIHKQSPAPPRQRLALLTARLHELGPRALLEFLLELLDGADLVERLEVYAAIDPATLRALGGDRLPPLRVIGGRR